MAQCMLMHVSISLWMCHIHPVCSTALNNYLRVFSYLLGFTSASIFKNVPSCTPTENLRSSNQSWKAPKGSCVKWIPLGECESHVLIAGSSPITRDFSNELPISRSSPRVLRLEAAAPHYHNNQLQVKVFWKSRLPGKWSVKKILPLLYVSELSQCIVLYVALWYCRDVMPFQCAGQYDCTWCETHCWRMHKSGAHEEFPLGNDHIKLNFKLPTLSSPQLHRL